MGLSMVPLAPLHRPHLPDISSRHTMQTSVTILPTESCSPSGFGAPIFHASYPLPCLCLSRLPGENCRLDPTMLGLVRIICLLSRGTKRLF
jgi:hypothetical protein